MSVMGKKPISLKFTQNSSDCVRQINSFSAAQKKKKKPQRMARWFHALSGKESASPIIIFSTFFLKKTPPKTPIPKRAFTIVGFMKNTVLLPENMARPAVTHIITVVRSKIPENLPVLTREYIKAISAKRLVAAHAFRQCCLRRLL